MLKITAIGNLTNDVELKMNENTGKPYAILRIASDRRYKDKDGNKLTDYKKELSINKGYDLTRQLQDLPEEQREQAAAEALEYEKAKKELKKQDAEIDRKGKIAALFCKAYEKAVLLTPSEENIRCWTDGTRMTPEEMRDTVKESRELAEVFRTIADIIEQKILPADWRCADAESEENDAQPDGNPA